MLPELAPDPLLWWLKGYTCVASLKTGLGIRPDWDLQVRRIVRLNYKVWREARGGSRPRLTHKAKDKRLSLLQAKHTYPLTCFSQLSLGQMVAASGHLLDWTLICSALQIYSLAQSNFLILQTTNFFIYTLETTLFIHKGDAIIKQEIPEKHCYIHGKYGILTLALVIISLSELLMWASISG